MTNPLTHLLRACAERFAAWCDDDTSEFPQAEGIDPLARASHATTPPRALDADAVICWHCPDCGAVLAENDFDAHLAAHRREQVWSGAINRLDFGAEETE